MIRQFAIRILPVILVLLLQACSWVNNFYFVNANPYSISLEFTLKDSSGSFPIFYTSSTPHIAYKLGKNNVPDRDRVAEVKKERLDSENHFKVELPPQTALQIGALQNDNYTSNKQHFINGRVFNLLSIKIQRSDRQGYTVIDPDRFDELLRHESGDLIYVYETQY